ncbi:MAG: polysaccharide biosynthesis tyrosine autokinase [Candidatus Omnitrophica bacterium]|nr:polysaccharide biosynthesis tyrosine autokinase [Candidatus Omnitrophota bacterium]
MNPIEHHHQSHELEEEIDLSDYWRILKRHKITVLTIFFVTVFTATIISVLMTPIYRSTVTLFVDQETSNVLTISDNNMALGAQSYATYKEYFQSQKEIVKSRGILEQVFKEFRLGQTPEYATLNIRPKSRPWSASVREFFQNITGSGTGEDSSTIEKYSGQTDLVKTFMDTVKVSDVRNTRLLKLQAEHTDPVRASEITNRIAQVYVERNLAYISKSEILNLHKNEFLKIQARLDELSKVYKSGHPQIIRLQEKMEEVKRKIKQERDENLPGQAPEISTSDLAGLKANNISVQDWAEPNFRPVRPNKRKNVLLAVIVGLFGGVGFAFFMEALDNTVKGDEDVRRLVDWPFLGYIPMVRKKKEEMLDKIVLEKPKSALSETYRTIRTGLLFSSTVEHPVKCVLLTSPGEQEGKSTTACNLAIVMAQNNKKVLLVDADMRKPRLHQVFNTDINKGLSTYLSGQSSFEEVVCTTDIANLSVITSGPHPPNPSELLASHKMEQFITYAKARYDYIFVDTPPTMVVTDAVILSKVVDGTIIVLESGRTSRKVVSMVGHTLRSAKSRVIGFIVNKIKAQSGDYENYYRYYSRYYGKDVRKNM